MLKKAFRIFIILIVSVVILIFGAIVYDFSTFHGGFTFDIIEGDKIEDYGSLISDNKYSDEEINIEYSITKQGNQYIFKISNNSLFPYAYYGATDSSYIHNMQDSVFMIFAKHNYASANNDSLDRRYQYYFGCGSGMGAVSFNIMESHEMIRTYDELVHFCLGPNQVIYQDSCCLDILNQTTLCCGEDTFVGEELYNLENIDKKDSLNITFFIQMHNYITKKLFNVYSNPVKVSYYDILLAHNKDTERNIEYSKKFSY